MKMMNIIKSNNKIRLKNLLKHFILHWLKAMIFSHILLLNINQLNKNLRIDLITIIVNINDSLYFFIIVCFKQF